MQKSLLYSGKQRRIAAVLFNFACLGGVNYLLNILLVWFCTEVLNIYYLFSVSISYIFITVSSFFLNAKFIFKSHGNYWNFVKYILMLLTFYGLHVGLVKLLTDELTLYYLYSVMISVAFLFLLKFFVYYKYVFPPHVDS